MSYNLIYPNLYFAHKIEEGPNFGEVFEKHFHLIYEILYFVKGDVDLYIENKIYHLKENDLLFIKPGQHHYVKPKMDTIYERYVIKFPEYLIPKVLLETLKNKPVCTNINGSPLTNLFQSIDWHYSYYTGDNLSLVLENTLGMILTYYSALEKNKGKETNTTNHKMSKVINYINENLSSPLQIENICEHFHYSKSYICKEFKNAMGVAIKEYIIAKRILLADSLIQNGHKPIEIYEKCGFIDYSTFYRNYVKIIGKAPSLGGAKTISISDIKEN